MHAHYQGVKSRIHAAGVAFNQRAGEEKRRLELAALERQSSHQKATVIDYLDRVNPWRGLVKHVSERHGISREKLLGKSRKAFIVAARHEVWWLARQLTNKSLTQIGSLVDCDHSTILHGITMFAGRLAAGETTISPEMALRVFGEC